LNAPAHIPAEAEAASATPAASPRVRRWARAADYGLEALAIGLMGAAALTLSLYTGGVRWWGNWPRITWPGAASRPRWR
jgi:hypothetical protein